MSFNPQLHQQKEITPIKQNQKVIENDIKLEQELKTLTAIVDKDKFTDEFSITSSKRFEELLIDEEESVSMSESNVLRQN